MVYANPLSETMITQTVEELLTDHVTLGSNRIDRI